MIKYKDKEKPKEIGLYGLGLGQKTNLDLGLDVFDGVGGLHLEGDGLASEGLNKDLHAAAESQDEVESALLLDVVVRQSASVLQLLPGEDQPLLVRRDPLLILRQKVHMKSKSTIHIS